MKINRKLLGAAAFSAALAGGGAAGALLGTPSLSGAQDDTETTDTTTEATPELGRPGRMHDGELLAAAAEALGMTEDELRTALQEDGASLASIAEAQGVDVQVVIDALVAQATERLEEIEAALPERMADLVEREGWGDGPRGRGHHHFEAGLEVAAEAIGITEDELREALQEDGATIASVAEANDVEVQTVIDAMVAAATERIDAAVESGDLDADRAEEMKANLVERITDRVNRDLGDRPFRDGPPELTPEDTGSDTSDAS